MLSVALRLGGFLSVRFLTHTLATFLLLLAFIRLLLLISFDLDLIDISTVDAPVLAFVLLVALNCGYKLDHVSVGTRAIVHLALDMVPLFTSRALDPFLTVDVV